MKPSAVVGGKFGKAAGGKVAVPAMVLARDLPEEFWKARWPVLEDGVRVILEGDPSEIRKRFFQVRAPASSSSFSA